MAEELLDVHSHVVRVEKLAGIGRLAAGVAHEMRNPLGALGTYVEVLRRRGSDPDVTAEMHVRDRAGRPDRAGIAGLCPARAPRRPAAAGGPGQTDLNAAVATGGGVSAGARGLLKGRNLALHLESGLPSACRAIGMGSSRWSSIC